jgi:hypothetical protein
MAKKFEVSERRYVVLKKHEIRLFEDGTRKMATFSYPRWAQFVEYFDEIDNAVAKLIKGEEEVKLQLHVGAAWYVSVTTGFRCIDLRKFFRAQDGAIKPTKTGFAIHLTEIGIYQDGQLHGLKPLKPDFVAGRYIDFFCDRR